MARSTFPCFMVSSEITRNRKMRRLAVAERWAWIGVLCIAAEAPFRGRFIVAGGPADADDLADEAAVSPNIAAHALSKFRDLGMLVHDPEHDCERVRDWSDYNPEPRTDRTNAERQARFRERKRKEREAEWQVLLERDGGKCRNCDATDDLTRDHIIPTSRGGSDSMDNLQVLCRACNASKREGNAPSSVIGPALRAERRNANNSASPSNREVEEEEETPPQPPSGGIALLPEKPVGKRGRDMFAFERQVEAFVSDHFPQLVGGAGYSLLAQARTHCDRRGVEPTADNLREYVERWAPSEAA